VQPAAELETFGTRDSDFRCVLAGTCTLRYASSWRGTDISRNLIRIRKCAHWDNKANPPHLPMMPSAAQQFQLEVASSRYSPQKYTQHLLNGTPAFHEMDPRPRWREVTRWSYKQPITLLIQRNEWCAVNQ
jgi:hypothetical protein